jgi:hypothetical protein
MLEGRQLKAYALGLVQRNSTAVALRARPTPVRVVPAVVISVVTGGA